MKEKKVYQCEYCGRFYFTEKIAKEHEDKCFYNPSTKSCATCKHLGIPVAHSYMTMEDDTGAGVENKCIGLIPSCNIGKPDFTDLKENIKRIGHERYNDEEFDKLEEQLEKGLYSDMERFRFKSNCPIYEPKYSDEAAKAIKRKPKYRKV